MARKKASREETPARTSSRTGGGAAVWRFEAAGIVLLLLAVGAIVGLFTFSPGASSKSQSLVGPVGHFVTRLVLQGLGVVGYVAATTFALLAGVTLVVRMRLPRVTASAAGVGVVLAFVVLGQLVASGSTVLGAPPGGALGGVTTELLRGHIGTAGTALLAMGVLLTSSLALLQISFGAVLTETGAFVRNAWLQAIGGLEVWREARAHERATADALLEAHRDETEARSRAQQEREEKLRRGLEEKKRAAIAKAEARAEQKVLAKRAADEAKRRLEAEAAEKARLEAEEKARLEAEEKARLEAEAAEREGLAAVGLLALAAPAAAAAPVAAGLAAPTSAASALVAAPALVASPLVVSSPLTDVRPSDRPLAATAEPIAIATPAARAVLPFELPTEDALEDEAHADTFMRPSGRPQASARVDAPGEPAPVDVVDPQNLLGPAIIPHRRDAPTEAMLEAAQPPSQLALIPPPKKARERRTYELPPLRLLDYKAPPPIELDREDLRTRATRLEEKLRTYGVDGRVTAIRPGPVVTTYEYLPAPGVKVSKIAGLSDDIAMAMTARSVRIIAPIPGKGVVGIELPNDHRENVFLKELIAHDRFQRSKSLLTLALGKDTEGEVQVRDLQKMPHILVAGTTGSGKSVSVNAMILSVLYKATPDQVKFIMVDPKMLELSLYDDIPHLLLPVVTDAKKASLALQWAVDEMERRYKLLSEYKVRNIEGFNKKLEILRDQRGRQAKRAAPPVVIDVGEGDDALDASALLADDASGPRLLEELARSTPPTDAADDGDDAAEAIDDPQPERELPEDMPYIVVLVDEFADLMCVAPRDVEMSIQRLAQKARAAGIHVMLATQRPSTDVVTGVIKNNFPSRIAFKVASRHDSATIINEPGAEHLLGMGDMLALSNTSPEPVRVHGAFVSEEEVQRVVEFWKQQGKPVFDQAILKPREDENAEGAEDLEAEKDEMYDRAVAIVVETRKASISAVQRRLRVGYNRAARMIELMEKEGLVSAPMGPKGDREVLAPPLPPP
jgi:S-DNA-T family DNA segregation ATPase FtsK/SpoIIIE